MTYLLDDYKNNKLTTELIENYSARKASNAAFSLRAYAKKLGVSSGALSEILKGKRRITMLTARKILENLNFSPLEIEEFFSGKIKSTRAYQDLSFDQYEVLSRWYYMSLLNFLELPHEKHNLKNISTRLNISSKKIEEALKRLLRLGMIEKNENRYQRTFIRYQSSEDIANAAVKKYHKQTLELSEKALDEVPVELRDFSSIILKINLKNLKKVKTMIRNFQDELSDLIDSDDPEEIYHMNVHLYPVSNNESAKRGKHV